MRETAAFSGGMVQGTVWALWRYSAAKQDTTLCFGIIDGHPAGSR